MRLTRRHAREWAIQMLTAIDLNPPDDIDIFCSDFWNALSTLDESDGHMGVNEKLRPFAEERVRGVFEHQQEIDSIIERYLENYEEDRLGTVERAVLRMGIWEINYSDVPVPVVINEAIDIVNWFASPKARPIINAILDRYAKSLENK